MIRCELECSAEPATVHLLLIDVDTWAIWSPHVARVEADTRIVETGWAGATRAFFSPAATPMIVDELTPNGGYRWHSTVGPWRLDYENKVLSRPGGSTIRFTAELSGPMATVLERVIAPLSARGQRLRMARLQALAELIDRRAASNGRS